MTDLSTYTYSTFDIIDYDDKPFWLSTLDFLSIPSHIVFGGKYVYPLHLLADEEEPTPLKKLSQATTFCKHPEDMDKLRQLQK